MIAMELSKIDSNDGLIGLVKIMNDDSFVFVLWFGSGEDRNR